MKTGYKIILIVITVLVVIYILLPYILRDYVNKSLNEVEGYQGRIESVDLALIRGGYAVNGFLLERTEEDKTLTYLEINRLRMTIDYRALIKGKIVADILVDHPTIDITPVEEDVDETDSTDWVKLVEDLIPIQINRLKIGNGRINFVDYLTDPNVNVYLHDLYLTATNLTNVETEDALPSSLILTGTSVGGGNLNINMEADFVREIPNMDMEMIFENIDLTAFNEMTQAYAKFQFDTGSLSLFSEVAIKEGIVNGYITPVLDEVKIQSDENEEVSFLQRIWEGALDVAANILESPPDEEHVATRVEIYGDLNEPETPVFPAVVNLLRNAFIESFQKELQGTIDFERVTPRGQQ